MKLVVIAFATLALAGSVRPHSLAGCSMFPADNPWNQRVDALPVAANSDAIIATIGPTVGLHPQAGLTGRMYERCAGRSTGKTSADRPSGSTPVFPEAPPASLGGDRQCDFL